MLEVVFRLYEKKKKKKHRVYIKDRAKRSLRK